MSTTRLGGFTYDINVNVSQLRVAQLNINRFSRNVIDRNKEIQDSNRSLIRSITDIAHAYYLIKDVGRGIGGVITQVDEYRRLQDRVASVSSTFEEYREAMDRTEAISRKLGYSLQGVTSSYARISQLKTSLKASSDEVFKLVEAFTGMARLSGASPEQLKSALEQLTQGLSNGKFQADELKIILEALPSATEQISKGLGVTTGKLMQMRQEGTLTSKDVFHAILKQSEEIEARVSLMPVRIDRVWASFKIDVTKSLVGLDEATNASNNLMYALTGLNFVMNQAVSIFISFVKNTGELQKFAGTLIQVAGAAIALTFAVNGLKSAFKNLLPAMASLTTGKGGLLMLGAGLLYLANNWEDTADRIAIAALKISGTTISAFTPNAVEADKLKENMDKQISAIKQRMDDRNKVVTTKTKEGQDSQLSQMESFFKKQKELLKKFYVDEANLIQAEEAKKKTKRDGLASQMVNHFRDMKLTDQSDILKQQNWLNRVPDKKDLKTTPEGNYPYLDIPKMESVMDKIEASEYESLRRRAANHSWFANTVGKITDGWKNFQLMTQRKLTDEETRAVHQRNLQHLQAASMHNKEMFAVWKAAAIANMAITMPKAIAESISAGSRYGPKVGLAYGLITSAAMGVQMGALLAANYRGGRALGGDVNPYSMYRVNEHGPEMLSIGSKQFLMMGNESGTVTPNNKLGGASKTNVIVNVSTDANQTAQVSQRETEEGVVIDVILKKVEDMISSGIRTGRSTVAKALMDTYALNRANGVFA